tara:strand:+ start:61 stop:615 length:555 start_codon:yes stop_codon:yes gene_type:complete
MTKPKELIIESPTHGQFKVLYDAEDEDKISKHKWCVSKNGSKFYVRAAVPHPSRGMQPRGSGGGSGESGPGQTCLQLHRLIMNTPKGMHTDHINGDPLDNRKENLRICTGAENQRNKGPQKNNTSGFKGVYWHKGSKKWSAQVAYNKKNIYIGCFKDKEEAARAHDAKAKELHGEFAYLNFPDE